MKYKAEAGMALVFIATIGLQGIWNALLLLGFMLIMWAILTA